MDISVIKCKNSEFYLLEPLKSPGLIRSFFGFIRRSFEQLKLSQKITQPTKWPISPNVVPGEWRVGSCPGLSKKTLTLRFYLDGIGLIPSKYVKDLILIQNRIRNYPHKLKKPECLFFQLLFITYQIRYFNTAFLYNNTLFFQLITHIFNFTLCTIVIAFF